MKRRRSQYTLLTLVEAGSAGLWAVVAPLIGDQRDLVALAQTCSSMYEHVRLTPECTVYTAPGVRKHMVRNAGTVVMAVPVAMTDLVCTFARMTSLCLGSVTEDALQLVTAHATLRNLTGRLLDVGAGAVHALFCSRSWDKLDLTSNQHVPFKHTPKPHTTARQWVKPTRIKLDLVLGELLGQYLATGQIRMTGGVGELDVPESTLFLRNNTTNSVHPPLGRVGVLIIHRVLHERVLPHYIQNVARAAPAQLKYPADANWNCTRLLDTFGPIKMHLDLCCTANLVDLFIGAHKLADFSEIVVLLAHLPAQIECVTLDRISKKESRPDTYALEDLAATWRVVREKLRALRSFVARSWNVSFPAALMRDCCANLSAAEQIQIRCISTVLDGPELVAVSPRIQQLELQLDTFGASDIRVCAAHTVHVQLRCLFVTTRLASRPGLVLDVQGHWSLDKNGEQNVCRT